MALHRIKDFDPDYRNHFDDHDLKGFDLYSGDEKVGSVSDLLVDDQGHSRYLMVNTGLWFLGKQVLLPIGLARINYIDKRVYADTLTKAQVEALPEFSDDMGLEYEHEEQVRGVYRSSMQNRSLYEPAAYGVGYAGADSAPNTLNTSGILDLEPGYAGYDRDTYSYEEEPNLYELNDQNHPNLRLYEERLVSSKVRQKMGEAVISKRVETETGQASVSVDKERVVIERMPTNGGATIPANEANFQPGEVSRMEVYEEVPEFRKEAFVREEVRVSKVVDQETATTEEKLRREELDVEIQGNPVVESHK